MKDMGPQREIGATVLRNDKNVLEALGSDGRIYRYTYYPKHVCAAFPPGTVVRLYYSEPEHNDIRVQTAELWDNPSYLVQDSETVTS